MVHTVVLGAVGYKATFLKRQVYACRHTKAKAVVVVVPYLQAFFHTTEILVINSEAENMTEIRVARVCQRQAEVGCMPCVLMLAGYRPAAGIIAATAPIPIRWGYSAYIQRYKAGKWLYG